MEWQPMETAPNNTRILIYGHDEMAMGWKDRVDGRLYYAPQGGLVHWEPTHWMPIPDAPV